MSRFRDVYGEGPLHLLAVIASLALAGWALVSALGSPGPLSFALFFAGAVVAHDLIAFPLYAALGWIAGSALPDAAIGEPSALNHVRVPAILSALALVVWFPLILGLSRPEYEITTGLGPPPYLARWLALTALLFAGSAVIWAARARFAGTTSEQEDKMGDPESGDFSGLRAAFLNCTLKPSPSFSHTGALMDVAAETMRAQGVEVETIRIADHDVPAGVQEDMTEHGFDADEWPAIQRTVLAADILVIGTPIWLGVKSSVATKVVERLYGYSGELNESGQSIYYGRVGGVVVTGNEDGVKGVAMETLYALSHLGYVIPPQADCGWIGEIGPGPSYADEGSGGTENEFTRRNTRIMCWNLMHLARMLRTSGGIPARGNRRDEE